MTSALIQNDLSKVWETGLSFFTFKISQFKSFSKMSDNEGMNIKNLIGNAAPIAPVKEASQVERQIKTDSTHDRDPNGQQYQQQEKKKERMSEEQFAKAVALLREKSFIKDFHWTVEALEENGFKFACVIDAQGTTIRRISEYDLWEVFDDVKSVETKGQLLRKTA